MEILLALSGDPYFPPQIPARLCYGKEYPYSRMDEVVNMVKEEGTRNKYRLSKVTKEMLAKIPEDQIHSLTTATNEFFYVRKPGEEISRVYAIQEVSPSQPWTIICSKEGGERIEFIKAGDPRYAIADSSLNYYRLREQAD
jgi:hypothetical protein